MLDDYKNNKFYNYAKNLKKYFHAYIFEVDDIETSYPLILAFIKMIICPNHYTNNKSCLDCNICHLIDENYYEDLKVIETTDKIIKKEQITKLQQELSLKSSNNTNQVYVIKEADKMNLNAANSLLKFIEEPEENIYGILITTNKKSLLSTILSRCQIIELKVEKETNYNLEDINNSLSFLTLIHEEKENSIDSLIDKMAELILDENRNYVGNEVADEAIKEIQEDAQKREGGKNNEKVKKTTARTRKNTTK